MQLQLVGAARFISPSIGEQLVQRGETVTVTPEAAQRLLVMTYTDGLNNVHPLWQEVTAPVPVAAVPKKRGRRTRPAVTPDAPDHPE